MTMGEISLIEIRGLIMNPRRNKRMEHPLRVADHPNEKRTRENDMKEVLLKADGLPLVGCSLRSGEIELTKTATAALVVSSSSGDLPELLGTGRLTKSVCMFYRVEYINGQETTRYYTGVCTETSCLDRHANYTQVRLNLKHVARTSKHHFDLFESSGGEQGFENEDQPPHRGHPRKQEVEQEILDLLIFIQALALDCDFGEFAPSPALYKVARDKVRYVEAGHTRRLFHGAEDHRHPAVDLQVKVNSVLEVTIVVTLRPEPGPDSGSDLWEIRFSCDSQTPGLSAPWKRGQELSTHKKPTDVEFDLWQDWFRMVKKLEGI